MILASTMLDLVCRLGGPRVSHDIQLWRLERWRSFEPEYFLLDHFADPERSAIDVGANEGFYAGRLSQLVPRVHCFEPIPWLAARLRQCLRPSVVVHEIAVSNRSGEAELRIPYQGDVQMHGTSTIEDRNALSEATRVETIHCQSVRLDERIDKEPVGFIKIDVEGHELAVLQGAYGIITRDRPVLLIESENRHNSTAPECVFEFLKDVGYFGFFLENDKLRALTAFDIGKHQRPENLVDGVRKIGLYVNNFIFIPG